jgi:hypothetical protein
MRSSSPSSSMSENAAPWLSKPPAAGIALANTPASQSVSHSDASAWLLTKRSTPDPPRSLVTAAVKAGLSFGPPGLRAEGTEVAVKPVHPPWAPAVVVVCGAAITAATSAIPSRECLILPRMNNPNQLHKVELVGFSPTAAPQTCLRTSTADVWHPTRFIRSIAPKS